MTKFAIEEHIIYVIDAENKPDAREKAKAIIGGLNLEILIRHEPIIYRGNKNE